MERLKASIKIMAKLCLDPRLTDEEKQAIAFISGFVCESDELMQIFARELNKVS